MAYCAEGKRASVYQLQDGQSRLWALKVFRPKFRDPSLKDQVNLAARTRGIQGLRSSNRRVLLPSAPAAKAFLELKYAILMPWIDGETWADFLLRPSRKVPLPPREELISTCYHLTRVLAQMEAMDIAHTDLSPGNLIVNLQLREVQLIDLEDMYFADRSNPRFENAGVPGYRPASVANGESLWTPAADRYAGAILAAEMLLFSQPGFAGIFTAEGLFRGPAGTPENDTRFKEAAQILKNTFPQFAATFSRTWNANTLQECPRLRQLLEAMTADVPMLDTAPKHPVRNNVRKPIAQSPRPSRPTSRQVSLGFIVALVVLALAYFVFLKP